MRMNHLNLTVPDVVQTREFFETYFGFRCVAERGRDALAVLVDESGFVLTLNNFEKADRSRIPRRVPHRLHAGEPGAGGRDLPALEGRRIRRGSRPGNSMGPGRSTSAPRAASSSRSGTNTGSGNETCRLLYGKLVLHSSRHPGTG